MIESLNTRTVRVLTLFAITTMAAGSLCGAETVSVLYESGGTGIGSRYSRPLGIFFDRARRECYVADTGNHQIVICDENGMALYRFQHNVTAGGKTVPGEPRSMVVDGAGRIFVTDTAAPYIDVLDPRGRSIGKILPPGSENGDRPARFECLALAPGDLVFATLSNDRSRIQVIDGDLTLCREIALAVPESDLACVTSIGVDGDGRIYITDPCAQENMVQVYDPDGKYAMGFGLHETGFGNFSFPAGVALMQNGDIWVVDTIRQIASRFSRQGEFLSFIGGKGDGPGAFNFPSALTSDGENRLFVLEREGNRYQCFDLAGNGQPQL